MTAATRTLFRPTKTRILYTALLLAVLVGLVVLFYAITIVRMGH